MRRFAYVAVICALAGSSVCAQTKTTGTASAEASTTASQETTLPGGTKIKDVKVGTGAEAKPGGTVTVHYTGTLTNGKKFDSSRDRNEPATFSLNQVVKGWGEGIPGMKVGGRRILTVPPSQGYGSRAMGDDIPANSTLIFDVELLGVQ